MTHSVTEGGKMECKWLKGKNIAPKTIKDAKALVGFNVVYLRNQDIDRSGRGFYFPRHGTVARQHGKNIEMTDGTWLALRDILEMSPTKEQG